jgi:hypothetical protein
MLVTTYKNTRFYNTEDHNWHFHRSENIRSKKNNCQLHKENHVAFN